MGGGSPHPTAHVSAENVISDHTDFNVNTLPLRDPQHFVSGQLGNCRSEWIRICDDSSPSIEVLSWISNGVDIADFFSHFKGNFKGQSYDCPLPPKRFFQNSAPCKNHLPFIAAELCERLKNGSLRLLGKLGECSLPHIVMPLTVEPSKPRLCHDERFLNLWMKNMPFQLDTLKYIHRH